MKKLFRLLALAILLPVGPLFASQSEPSPPPSAAPSPESPAPTPAATPIPSKGKGSFFGRGNPPSSEERRSFRMGGWPLNIPLAFQPSVGVSLRGAIAPLGRWPEVLGAQIGMGSRFGHLHIDGFLEAGQLSGKNGKMYFGHGGRLFLTPLFASWDTVMADSTRHLVSIFPVEVFVGGGAIWTFKSKSLRLKEKAEKTEKSEDENADDSEISRSVKEADRIGYGTLGIEIKGLLLEVQGIEGVDRPVAFLPKATIIQRF